jgi:predicted ATPase/class 3 adenylate cyclase
VWNDVLVSGPSGTVTFLFTDIEGSTRMWQVDEEAMRRAVSRHDELLRTSVAEQGGTIFSTAGDGMAVVFAGAEAAVRAAETAQDRLAAEGWPTVEPVRVRMGIHSGEAEERDGDYFGTAVNRAARLMAVGHGGQVLCSATTADLVEGKVALLDLGEHRLRDLDKPVHLFQVGGGSFPPLNSVDAFPGNLPLQVSSFVGRRREIDRVAKAIEECRVVTLTGVGGVGKTRLAVQVAAEVLPRFREGAWLVELAPVRDPEGVVAAFASVFGLGPRAGMTLEESLVEFLRTKQLLMVVDNCEHLLDPIARLASVLEHSCSSVVLLATSREGLALEGERVIPVPSLASPDPDADLDELAGSDAVALFVDRASGADPDFFLSAQNAASVSQICARLDGVPLALELAASQITVMTPAELAGGLDRRFETLAGGRRGAVQRHQTLRAAIDWSYDLCSSSEQRVLSRLSVFAGGCTREAAEVVCSGGPVDRGAVFPALRSLVAKSLVVAERDYPETRYRLLETIREYAEERLAETGETGEVRTRHAWSCVQFARRTSADLFGARHVDAERRLRAEDDNFMAAIKRAIDTEDADLGLQFLGGIAGHGIGQTMSVGLVAACASVVALPEAPRHPFYPTALAFLGFRSSGEGDLDAANYYIARAEEARGPQSEAGDAIAWFVTYARGTMTLLNADHGDAVSHFERAAEISVKAGHIGRAAYDFGHAAFESVLSGDREHAESLASEGLALARRVGNPGCIAVNLNALAGALTGKDSERARSLLREGSELVPPADRGAVDLVQSVLLWAELGEWKETLELAVPAIRSVHWATRWFNLVGLYNVVARALLDFDVEAAAVLQGAARHFVTESRGGKEARPAEAAGAASAGAGLVPDLRRQTTALLVEALGSERLHELRARGESMTNDEAVAFAIEVISKAAAGSGLQQSGAVVREND